MMKINKNVTWSLNRSDPFIEKICENKRILINESSLFIWSLIITGMSEEEIQKKCVESFPDAEPKTINEDIHDFIEFLVREGIIE